MVFVGVFLVAADVEISFGLQIGVVGARNPVLFGVGLLRKLVHAQLVGLKNRAELVILGLRNRVVLMVVATGAVDGQTQERLGAMFDGSIQPHVAVVVAVVARQETGCRQHLGIVRGQLVAGQHLEDHPIVTFVGVERIDDPVSPAPNMLLAVAHILLVSAPIAIAPYVHPVASPTFAVVRIV